jgi:DNA polymerase-3 subunit delta
LVDYLKSPTPGTVLVFECSRFDFDQDDRPKLERVEKYYAAVPAVVEFRHFTPDSVRYLAQDLVRKFQLKMGNAELAILLEAVSGDAQRLAGEIEKLALFVGHERSVTMDDLQTLVPNAAQATIFTLVSALGKRDRVTALRSLDLLVREGEYLPLALTFLSTQFRLALAASEERLRGAQQVQSFFQKKQVRMWRDRAEQIAATTNAFTPQQLASAVTMIYETDKRFRDGYKDDHMVMETLVIALTA